MKTIAVATDFSSRSDRALLRAVRIARKAGARLALLHVVDDDQPAEVVDASRREAQRVLDSLIRNLGGESSVEASSLIGAGDIPDGILRCAEQAGADLIILGPHRKRAVDIFTGTTVERVLRRCSLPLLIAVDTPSNDHRRTLLAVDFDEASKAAAKAALALGLFDSTDVVVMHAFDAPAGRMMERTLIDQREIDQYRADEKVRATRELHAMLGELGLSPSTTRVVGVLGSPAYTILQSAEMEVADLVIVGTSRRKGFARLLVGSIAEEVIRQTRRDILIVPVP